MNRAETAELLTMIAAYDRRKLGEVDVIAWAETLPDVALTDARAVVVEHYAASTDWLMPAHIRAGVKRIRRDRLERAPQVVPDADPDDPVAWRQALLDGRMRAADGTERRHDMRVIEGTFPSPPTADTAAGLAACRAAIGPRRPDPARPSHADADAMAQARAEIAAREPVPTDGGA